MGRFFTNLHVRAADHKAVSAAVKSLGCLPAYISPKVNDWVTISPRPTEAQDKKALAALGDALSKELKATVISFLVHDGDVFQYTLHEKGKTVDKYDSWPGYASKRMPQPKVGKPQLLLPYCSSTTETELSNLLSRASDGDATVEALSILLGLAQPYACKGFRRLYREGAGSEYEFLPAPPSTEKQGAPSFIGEEEKLVLTTGNQRFHPSNYPAEIPLGEFQTQDIIVLNEGSPSNGIKVIASGDALAKGHIESVSGHVSFFEGDEEDGEYSWPYVLNFESAKDSSLVATVADFPYEGKLQLRFRARGKADGQATVDFEIAPLSAEGKSAQCSRSVIVRAGKPGIAAVAAQQQITTADTVQSCGPYQLQVPAGYQLNPYTNDGQYLEFKRLGEFDSIEVIRCTMIKTSNPDYMARLLSQRGEEQKCRQWNPTPIKEETTNGIAVQKSYWSANKEQFGIVLTAAANDEILQIDAQSPDEEGYPTLEKILSTLRHKA